MSVKKLFPLHQRLILLFSFFTFVFSSTVYSQNIKVPNASPDDEKRSCIKAVDGYAYLSDDTTLSQIKAAAFADAKRNALEMAKTYIASKTKMENFVVKYDAVWAESEGAVSVLEQKDYGIEDNSRYHVWIMAEVEYTLKPKGNAPVQEVMEKDAPLTVKVWTSKKRYKDGERIEIHLKGNCDFYARIVDITSSGHIIQLLPNDYRKASFFKGGKVYHIPDEADRFDLRVSPPYGEDQIIVYASEVPLGDVEMESAGQGLKLYRGSKKTLGARTRGISVVSDAGDYTSSVEFYEAVWKVKTEQ
jgi:uncharacterized protein DUF4384